MLDKTIKLVETRLYPINILHVSSPNGLYAGREDVVVRSQADVVHLLRLVQQGHDLLALLESVCGRRADDELRGHVVVVRIVGEDDALVGQQDFAGR